MKSTRITIAVLAIATTGILAGCTTAPAPNYNEEEAGHAAGYALAIADATDWYKYQKCVHSYDAANEQTLAEKVCPIGQDTLRRLYRAHAIDFPVGRIGE